MHVGNFWWKWQNTLPVSGMLIPFTCQSDNTLLTAMAVNYCPWLVYLTAGNSEGSYNYF